MLKTESGNKEVFDTGLVITFKNEPLIFQLNEDLKISITFDKDENTKGQALQSKTIDKKNLELILVNFNNSLGTGTTEPLELGTINNRVLYLNFIVYTLGDDAQKSFQYTWYLGEEVNHG